MGVATGILIAAGVSAAASAYSAKKQANAAKDAAALESGSADKALAVQERMYTQSREDATPYRQAGAGALGNLQAMSQGPRNTFNPGAPMASLGNPAGAQLGAYAQQNRPPTGMGQNPGQMPPGAPMAPQGVPQGGQGAGALQGQPGGPMVTMEGPDGARRPVPMQVAEQLKQRGFRMVQ